nr:nodulin MtN21 /EamA-like transporter family protein [Tanacetum cinerariifolium]
TQAEHPEDPSKVTKIELTAYMISVNNQKDSVYPLLLSAKKKKGQSQTVTPTLPKSQGPEAFRALSKKRKQPKNKNTPNETKPADMNLTFIVFDKGAAKTMSFPEGPCGDKDLEGFKPPADMEPQTNPIAYPSRTDANDGDVFEAREDIEEDTQPGKEEHHIEMGDILNALNGVTKALKAIQDAIKENPTLPTKVIESIEAYIKNSNDMLTLINNFDF